MRGQCCNAHRVEDGYAFLKFFDKSSAVRALESECGSEWLGKRLKVKFPDSSFVKKNKNEYQKQQQQQQLSKYQQHQQQLSIYSLGSPYEWVCRHLVSKNLITI